MAERQQAALGDSPAAGRATRSTMHAPILIRRPRGAPEFATSERIRVRNCGADASQNTGEWRTIRPPL
jgi:hypothetical protein